MVAGPRSKADRHGGGVNPREHVQIGGGRARRDNHRTRGRPEGTAGNMGQGYRITRQNRKEGGARNRQ